MTFLVGLNQTPTVSSNVSNGYTEVFKQVVAASGQVANAQVSINASRPTAVLRVAVYADNAGYPGVLLGRSDELVETTVGWNVVPFTDVVNLTLGDTVWLGIMASGATASLMNIYNLVSADTYYHADTYPVPASPFPAGGTWTLNPLSVFLEATTVVVPQPVVTITT